MLRFKNLVNYLLIIALCFPLFFVPVAAQVSSSAPDFLSEPQKDKWNELISSVPYTDNLVIYYYSPNSSLRWSYDFDYPTSTGSNSIRTNLRYFMDLDGSIRVSFGGLTVNTSTSVDNIFYIIKKSKNLYFGSDLLDSFFDVGLPVVSGCAVGSLYALSNPYVSSLINTYVSNVSNLINWTVYSITEISSSTNASICNSSDFDYSGERVGYRIDLVYNTGDTASYTVYSSYKQGYYGASVSGSCSWIPVSNSDWVLRSSSVVLTSSCYTQLLEDLNATVEVNDSKGNQLIESGNSSSQSASSSLDQVTSIFDNSAAQLESFESQFNSGMTSALADINISGGNLGNNMDFLRTADFIKTQFDTILDNSGIYKSVITFSLILGLALLLIGRRS